MSDMRPELPSGDASPKARAAPVAAPYEECDLCGVRTDPDDFIEALRVSICGLCLEAMLDAPTDEPRAEVGLVGSGGGRQ